MQFSSSLSLECYKIQISGEARISSGSAETLRFNECSSDVKFRQKIKLIALLTTQSIGRPQHHNELTVFSLIKSVCNDTFYLVYSIVSFVPCRQMLIFIKAEKNECRICKLNSLSVQNAGNIYIFFFHPVLI